MKTVKLANPEHALPYPGAPGRLVTGDEVIEINENHPFWNACLRDGSLVEVPASPASAKPSATKEPN